MEKIKFIRGRIRRQRPLQLSCVTIRGANTVCTPEAVEKDKFTACSPEAVKKEKLTAEDEILPEESVTSIISQMMHQHHSLVNNEPNQPQELNQNKLFRYEREQRSLRDKCSKEFQHVWQNIDLPEELQQQKQQHSYTQQEPLQHESHSRLQQKLLHAHSQKEKLHKIPQKEHLHTEPQQEMQHTKPLPDLLPWPWLEGVQSETQQQLSKRPQMEELLPQLQEEHHVRIKQEQLQSESQELCPNPQMEQLQSGPQKEQLYPKPQEQQLPPNPQQVQIQPESQNILFLPLPLQNHLLQIPQQGQHHLEQQNQQQDPQEHLVSESVEKLNLTPHQAQHQPETQQEGLQPTPQQMQLQPNPQPVLMVPATQQNLLLLGTLSQPGELPLEQKINQLLQLKPQEQLFSQEKLDPKHDNLPLGPCQEQLHPKPQQQKTHQEPQHMVMRTALQQQQSLLILQQKLQQEQLQQPRSSQQLQSRSEELNLKSQQEQLQQEPQQDLQIAPQQMELRLTPKKLQLLLVLQQGQQQPKPPNPPVWRVGGQSAASCPCHLQRGGTPTLGEASVVGKTLFQPWFFSGRRDCSARQSREQQQQQQPKPVPSPCSARQSREQQQQQQQQQSKPRLRKLLPKPTHELQLKSPVHYELQLKSPVQKELQLKSPKQKKLRVKSPQKKWPTQKQQQSKVQEKPLSNNEQEQKELDDQHNLLLEWLNENLCQVKLGPQHERQQQECFQSDSQTLQSKLQQKHVQSKVQQEEWPGPQNHPQPISQDWLQPDEHQEQGKLQEEQSGLEKLQKLKEKLREGNLEEQLRKKPRQEELEELSNKPQQNLQGQLKEKLQEKLQDQQRKEPHLEELKGSLPQDQKQQKVYHLQLLVEPHEKQVHKKIHKEQLQDCPEMQLQKMLLEQQGEKSQQEGSKGIQQDCQKLLQIQPQMQQNSEEKLQGSPRRMLEQHDGECEKQQERHDMLQSNQHEQPKGNVQNSQPENMSQQEKSQNHMLLEEPQHKQLQGNTQKEQVQKPKQAQLKDMGLFRQGILNRNSHRTYQAATTHTKRFGPRRNRVVDPLLRFLRIKMASVTRIDVEEAACIWLLHRRLNRRKQRQRRHWVHPILQDRHTQGMFATLYPSLREHDKKFFNYLRMSVKSFDDLLELIKEDISSTKTMIRESICPEQKLVITLRYLATGCSIADLHYGYRLGKSTISGILRQVCAAIWARLKTMHMPEMTKERWEEVAEGFEKYANFPNCIGAIDGKHIRLVQPAGKGSLYSNKKSFFSTVLLAVCDANYSFTYVDIGAYGKDNDSAVFTHSLLYKKLVEKTLDVPGPKPISTADTTCLPHVIVGDEAFGIMENVMRPYSGKQLTYKKKIFNYRLSGAHRYIECTFGILANKWRIFHRSLNVNIDFAEDIVKACCILHNYVKARDGYRYEDTLYQAPMVGLLEGNVPRGGMFATSVRDRYADYFVNEGKLELQDRMI